MLVSNLTFANEIEIQHADLLELGKKELKINGNARIKYMNALIEAPEGIIKTNTSGDYDTAVFTGRVKLSTNNRSIEADKITISPNNNSIIAEGNTTSKLKDKDNNPITITCNLQELFWDGRDITAKDNLVIYYKDTKVTSDTGKVIYKNNKPDQVIFTSNNKNAKVEQPTNITSAEEFILDLNTHNLWAFGEVKSTIWPNKNISKSMQDPVYLNTDNMYLDNSTGNITAKGKEKQVTVSYQETMGSSNEATLIRKSISQTPEKIIFVGNANVSQTDKQINSEEVVFNFNDKKLISNTVTDKRPKTIIFKNEK